MFDTAFLQIANKFKSLDRIPKWLRESLPWSKQVYLIRRALGMTQRQLARAIASDPRSIVRLEKAEVDPRLSTLERVAEQLNCELLIRLVPKQEMGEYLSSQAKTQAKQIVHQSVGTANVEVQKPSNKSIQWEIKKLTEALLKKPSKLWDS